MKRIIKWIIDSHLRALVVLATVATFGGATFAATSWDVTNEPQMNLDVNINQTQTTGVIIASRQLNGEDYTHDTLSGGILRIRWGSFREDIHFTGSTVNATTNRVTLQGVTRNICPHYTDRIVSCGNGRNWGKGAIVELIQDARLFNLKADIDRVNLLTGSGQISGTGTGQAIVDLPCVTSSQRDSMTNVSDGQIICNSTLGTFQYRAANTWISFGSGSTINASETQAGKVQLSTLAALRALTSTGSTGALNVIPMKWVLKNGTGALSAGYIPSLGSDGAIHVSLGGTGSGSWVGSGVLIGNGRKDFTQVQPGNTGNLLTSNGQEWVSSPASSCVPLYIPTADSNQAGAGSTAEVEVSRNYTITGGTLRVGDKIIFEADGSYAAQTNPSALRLKLGSTTIATMSGVTASGLQRPMTLRGEFVVRSIGASGTVQPKLHFTLANAAQANGAGTGSTFQILTRVNAVTVDTTVDSKLAFSYQIGNSNSDNGLLFKNVIVSRCRL